MAAEAEKACEECMGIENWLDKDGSCPNCRTVTQQIFVYAFFHSFVGLYLDR